MSPKKLLVEAEVAERQQLAEVPIVDVFLRELYSLLASSEVVLAFRVLVFQMFFTDIMSL